ncbi:MAG: hypothetical protein K2X49_19520 [Acetobacteraceae bacterium]|nr:hypothetical protein [Acetobacteraceae bacterium]
MSKSRLPPIPPGGRPPMGGAGAAPGGARNTRSAGAGKVTRNNNPASQSGQGKLRDSSARPGGRGSR